MPPAQRGWSLKIRFWIHRHGEKVLADDRMFGFLARHFTGKTFVGYGEMPILIDYLNERQQNIFLATDDLRAMGYADASSSMSYFSCSGGRPGSL
jgi:hypothetical protein